MINDRFYYNKLQDDEKVIYKKLYTGIEDLSDGISLENAKDKFSTEMVLPKIIQALEFDNPHFFYCDFSSYVTDVTNQQINITFSYMGNQEDIADTKKDIEKNVNKLMKQINGYPSNDHEKVLAIHNGMVRSVKYHPEPMDTNSKSDTSTKGMENADIRGPILRKEAGSRGISKAYKFLLNLIGIKSIVVSGILKSSKQSHYWNIVKIDGEVYHHDLSLDIKKSTQEEVAYDYFNLTDIQIKNSHAFPDDFPRSSHGQNINAQPDTKSGKVPFKVVPIKLPNPPPPPGRIIDVNDIRDLESARRALVKLNQLRPIYGNFLFALIEVLDSFRNNLAQSKDIVEQWFPPPQSTHDMFVQRFDVACASFLSILCKAIDLMKKGRF